MTSNFPFGNIAGTSPGLSSRGISGYEMKSLLTIAILMLPLAASAQDRPLAIEDAVRLAVERNERAAIADTTVEAAEARVSRARSILRPQVDVNGSYRNDSAADTRNTLSTSATLTQALFNARAFPLMRQARLELDAARASASESHRILGYDAANVFVATLNVQQVLEAAEHRRDFAKATLDDARGRFEAGLVSSNDVTKAQLELSTAERVVAQAQGDLLAQRVELANVIDTEVGALQEPVSLFAAAAQPVATTTELVQQAQERRGDVVAGRARASALRAFAEEPAKRFIPSLLLNAQTRNVNEGSISDRSNDGFVGVSLSWPVLDGGLRRADTRERNAIARGAELEVDLNLRAVESQLRAASVQLTAEQSAVKLAESALNAARRNANETGELYRQGLANALELADANQRLFEAEVAAVTTRYRMAAAYLALREASGEGAVE
jgi:outer membrane protein TolC